MFIQYPLLSELQLKKSISWTFIIVVVVCAFTVIKKEDDLHSNKVILINLKY